MLGWTALADFHPVALATPLLLGAWWFLDEEQRLLPFALLAGLAMLTKEHVGLVVAGMGVWHAISRRRPVPGLPIAAAGLAVSVLTVALVIPHFSPSGASVFGARYGGIGGSPGGIARTAVHHPGRIAAEATERRDALYVVRLSAPVAALALLAPEALLAAVPRARPEPALRHPHADLDPAPLLGRGARGDCGGGDLRRRAPDSTRSATGRARRCGRRSSAAVGDILGPLPIWRGLPGGDGLPRETFRVTEHDREAARALRLIPKDTVVSASKLLGAHLSERRRILSFRALARRALDRGGRDESRLPRPHRAPAVRPRHPAELRGDPRWELVHARDGVLVFRRR